MLDVIYCDQIFRSESALAALQLPTHFGWVSYSTKEDSDKKTHQNHTWSQLTQWLAPPRKNCCRKYPELSNLHKIWNIVHNVNNHIEEKLGSEMFR